jgi:hypothetical protein
MAEPQIPNRLTWQSEDPGSTIAWLRRLGFAVSPAGIVELPPVQVRIVRSDGHGDRLAETPDAPHAPDAPHELDAAHTSATGRPATAKRARAMPGPNGIVGLVALGWATVDAERTARGAIDPFEDAPDDPHLGAFARRSTNGPTRIVLLEPNTEGRLAATLVRHGEGLAALYLAAGLSGVQEVAAAVRRAGGTTTAIRDGPLGPSILLAGGPPAGPHLIVVEPGTIRS